MSIQRLLMLRHHLAPPIVPSVLTDLRLAASGTSIYPPRLPLSHIYTWPNLQKVYVMYRPVKRNTETGQSSSSACGTAQLDASESYSPNLKCKRWHNNLREKKIMIVVHTGASNAAFPLFSLLPRNNAIIPVYFAVPFISARFCFDTVPFLVYVFCRMFIGRSNYLSLVCTYVTICSRGTVLTYDTGPCSIF